MSRPINEELLSLQRHITVELDSSLDVSVCLSISLSLCVCVMESGRWPSVIFFLSGLSRVGWHAVVFRFTVPLEFFPLRR